MGQHSSSGASGQCFVELFGDLRVRQEDRIIDRFRTFKTAALMAYLAYYGDQMHPRTLLVETFWPDATTPTAGLTSLSVALSALRTHLEPPGMTPQTFLRADRESVGLSALVAVDVAEFERHLAEADHARAEQDLRTEKQRLSAALSLYRSGLLPGYNDPWLLWERTHLTEKFQQASVRLAALQAAG